MLTYIKRHWLTLVLIALIVLLCSIPTTFTIPYYLGRWMSDRSTGTAHVAIGAVSGMAGLVLAAAVLKTQFQKNGMDWKKEIPVYLAGYLLVQLGASLIFGLTGHLVYTVGGMSYQGSQTLVNICISVWQNLIRVVFLYMLIARKNHRNWRKNFGRFWFGFVLAIGLSAVPIYFTLIEESNAVKVLGIAWAMIYITAYAAVFDCGTRRGRE